MHILTNPLLSRNFMFNNLKLTDKGLFYMSKSEDNKIIHQIFITDDAVKIINLMKLPEAVLNIPFEEADRFFDILIDNNFFKTKKFRFDVSKGESKLLSKFAEYLTDKEFDESYEKISLELVLNHFRTESVFLNKLQKSVEIIDNPKLIKVDGKLIFSLIPDFDKYKITDTLSVFYKEYFEDDIDRDFFLLKKDMEEIKKILLEIVSRF